MFISNDSLILEGGGPVIPLIGSEPAYMALINAFTESLTGILRLLTGRAGAGQGGPEPFSQKAP